MKTRYNELEHEVGVRTALVVVLLAMMVWVAIDGYVAYQLMDSVILGVRLFPFVVSTMVIKFVSVVIALARPSTAPKRGVWWAYRVVLRSAVIWALLLQGDTYLALILLVLFIAALFHKYEEGKNE